MSDQHPRHSIEDLPSAMAHTSESGGKVALELSEGSLIFENIPMPDRSAVVNLTELAAKVRTTRSASTAKGYLAVLRRLSDYLHSDFLPLEEVTPGFVAGFSRYLSGTGLSPATAAMYLRSLRALLRGAFGRGCARHLAEAFAMAGNTMVPAETGGALCASGLHRINDADLSVHPWLWRVRDLFMLSFYGCGATLQRLRQVAGNGEPQAWDAFGAGCWMRDAAASFAATHGMPLADALGRLSDESYANGLAALGSYLGLRSPLTPSAAGRGWAAAARSLGISSDIIAQAVCAAAAGAVDCSCGDAPNGITDNDSITYATRDAACRVASSLRDLTERWYAMRCLATDPAEIAPQLGEKAGSGERQIPTFVPPAPESETRHSGPGARLMGSLLFFRCRQAEAAVLARRMAPGCRIYAGGDNMPAPIDPGEMAAFMIVAGAGGDTVRMHFPGQTEAMPDFTENDVVTITDGTFTGHVGLVGKVGRDRLRVLVRITALNGAVVSAEIPATFLRHVSASLR